MAIHLSLSLYIYIYTYIYICIYIYVYVYMYTVPATAFGLLICQAWPRRKTNDIKIYFQCWATGRKKKKCLFVSDGRKKLIPCGSVWISFEFPGSHLVTNDDCAATSVHTGLFKQIPSHVGWVLGEWTKKTKTSDSILLGESAKKLIHIFILAGRMGET